MKKKAVLQVSMKCQKCRTEALKVAAKQEGVSYVGIEGEQRDKVVVIGDGVDFIKLTKKIEEEGWVYPNDQFG
ncbi:hypothetical protein COLO4_33258 [Corchorus olitorius]|uniref:HMA domain-containing protein n=2 Tax=Corchorus TaxID=93758 RepID=A0A1R3GVG7_9ROSI|nr:hypothetical protein COLO4_33258 [Corchorus olitorius]